MWSAVGVVFDCASKRSMTERMQGRDIDGERRRGIDSEIPGVSIAHLEGTVREVGGVVTVGAGGLRSETSNSDGSDGPCLRRTPLDHSDPQLSSTMSGGGMNTPLLDTIEPDEPSEVPQPQPKATAHQPVVLKPTGRPTEDRKSVV